MRDVTGLQMDYQSFSRRIEIGSIILLQADAYAGDFL